MKKLILSISLLLIVLFSISASDISFWVGYPTQSDTWKDSDIIAFTDKYTPNSVLSISYLNKSISVTVYSSLPQTIEGRTIGLTSAALEELGLWGKGDEDITCILQRGSLTELEEKEIPKESGWYSLFLSPISKEAASSAYKSLVSKGFKPNVVEYKDDLFYFSIPYIVEYEIDEKVEVLSSISLCVEKIESEENPYL